MNRGLLLALAVVAATGCAPRTGPYIWSCTPVIYFPRSTTPPTVFVFNRGSTPAKVAVNVLNRDGTNLAGMQVPGAAPGTVYPGHMGTSTVTVAPESTLLVVWETPPGNVPQTADVAVAARIVSDQPVVVGSNVELIGNNPITCTAVNP